MRIAQGRDADEARFPDRGQGLCEVAVIVRAEPARLCMGFVSRSKELVRTVEKRTYP